MTAGLRDADADLRNGRPQRATEQAEHARDAMVVGDPFEHAIWRRQNAIDGPYPTSRLNASGKP
jgi:hypothetical protein